MNRSFFSWKALLLLTAFILPAAGLFAGGQKEEPTPAVVEKLTVATAELDSDKSVKLRVRGLKGEIASLVFTFEPPLPLAGPAEAAGAFYILKTSERFQFGTSYTLNWSDPATGESGQVKIDGANLNELVFNAMDTDKVLGYSFEGGKSVFRLFVPRGKTVELVLFDRFDDAIDKAKLIPMTNDGNQVFEAFVDGPLWGRFYGYRILERTGLSAAFLPTIPLDTVFADPYSKATAQNNVYPQKSRTLILDTSKFNWEGDKPTGQKLETTVIMEAHLRDLTAHPSALVPDMPNKGSYKGFVQAQRGGLAYLKSLGVNAVEFLPLHDFGNIEPPFKEKTPYGPSNTWNAYAQNYWGYMTSNFFAPESYFASDGTLDPARWNGTDGRAVSELKEMVKQLHKAGIAVVMDVVYNHVSQYDENALKLIDYDFYFKKSDKTGTGNEVQTRRKMVRRLVVDSLTYWMRDYHIDGFRFDLASSFDKESSKLFRDAILAVNPAAFVIAEPWGGEGATSGGDFDKLGWSKWNAEIRDKFRTKTRPTEDDPVFGLGNNPLAMDFYDFWSGSVGGTKSYQQVAYIESHDDTTFGDALRVLSGQYKFLTPDKKPNRIPDISAYTRLTPDLLLAHKISAAGLLLCQGPVMLHIGQEWARGKITPDLTGKIEEVTTKGRIGSSSDNVVFRVPTPNSYSADNETNWIDFNLIAVNQELFDYYQGLLKLRASTAFWGTTPADKIAILESANPHSLGVSVDGKLYGFVNADRTAAAAFTLPAGRYSVLADTDKAGPSELREIAGGTISVPAGALILIRK